jgi:hypothetical protein
MNGLRPNATLLLASALLAILAVAAYPALASGDRDGSADHSGEDSGHGGSEDQANEHRGDSDNDPGDRGEDRGDRGDKGGDRDKSDLDRPDKPRKGEHMNAAPQSGVVLIRLPGSNRAVPLKDGASIPVGSVVDARRGKVKLDSAPDSAGHPQFASFTGAVFQVLQGHTGEVVTEIRLRGRKLGLCKQLARRQSVFGRSFAPVASMSAKRRPVRKLWGSGKGHFRTRGRHGAATVRGTVWLTADYCDGTLVKVKRGLVGVTDFHRHKTVEVPAGHSYFARAP